MICGLGLMVLATLSCCKGSDKVTAIVAGPDHAVVALDIAYDAPICPKSVTPEAFEVEGREVVCAKACKEGHVIVLLKPVCKGEKPECEKACEGKPECGEKPACDKPCEPKPECCEPKPECEKACEAKPCCKPECCDEPKPCKEEGKECCDKPECCKNGGKPCCKEGKPECAPKPECKKECKKIAVPKISVKQVGELKDVDGNAVPAWSKALKAGQVKPMHKPCGEKPACGEHHDDCAKPCDKPADQQCDKCKAE